MKKLSKLTSMFALLIPLVFISCGGNDEAEKDTTNIQAPPSITQEVVAKTNQIIKLEAEQSKLLNIKTIAIKKEILNYDITAPAIVYPAPENISVISAPISGRVIAIYAHEGEPVSKGQLLLEIESLDYGTLVADMLQSNAEENYQKNQLERITTLYEKRISSQSDLEKAKADYTRASANFRASFSKLQAVGVSDDRIKKIISGEEDDPHLKIFCPINGTIDQHLVDLGKAVNSLEMMMSVVDLSRVLVRGYISPEEGANVKVGDNVCISQKDFGQKICSAKITSINPALDEANKSLVVNILTGTVNKFPKPGSNVTIDVSVSTNYNVIAVPSSAISFDGNEPTAYVKKNNTTFEKRFLTVQKTSGDNLIVTKGLNEGDEVAVSQIFSLKALGRFEQFAEE